MTRLIAELLPSVEKRVKLVKRVKGGSAYVQHSVCTVRSARRKDEEVSKKVKQLQYITYNFMYVSRGSGLTYI